MELSPYLIEMIFDRDEIIEGKYSIWQLKFASLNLLVEHYQHASISRNGHAYLAPIEPNENQKTIVIAVVSVLFLFYGR